MNKNSALHKSILNKEALLKISYTDGYTTEKRISRDEKVQLSRIQRIDAGQKHILTQ